MSVAAGLLFIAKVWGWTGAAVALLFLTFGIDRIDEDARGAYAFRPLLIPGILVLWPLVLWQWYRSEADLQNWPDRYDPPRKSHFAVGLLLPLGLVAIIGTGLAVRQTWPADFAPLHLSAPADVSQ